MDDTLVVHHNWGFFSNCMIRLKHIIYYIKDKKKRTQVYQYC